MGPSLVRLATRASETAGVRRRVRAASIFESDKQRLELERAGADTISCDLLDPGRLLKSLHAGMSSTWPAQVRLHRQADLTWAINALLPAGVLQRFRDANIVAFSSGNIYRSLP